ncbi:hypothetical protein Bca4012_018385 [Brassica carinata]
MNDFVARKMEKKSKEKEGEAEKTRQEGERKQNREKEKTTVKGLPHEQVPQPGKDFSSEALENLPNPKMFISEYASKEMVRFMPECDRCFHVDFIEM